MGHLAPHFDPRRTEMFEKHMGIVRFAKLPSDYEFEASESAVSFVKALCNAFTRISILSTFEIPFVYF